MFRVTLILLYMSVVAILVMWPVPFKQTLVPHLYRVPYESPVVIMLTDDRAHHWYTISPGDL